jgi:acetyl esterase/lipase
MPAGMRGVPAGVSVAIAACALALPVAAASADELQPAIVRDVRHPRGTVVLVHAGGWVGPDRERQWALDWWPGAVFRRAGWSTRTIDYAAGKAGLGSVTAEIAAAIARSPRRPVCAYGESSGGHLALLAAAALPRMRCVIGLGAPTDFERWRSDAVREGRAFSLTSYSQTVVPTFGAGRVEDAWEPVAAAARIRARVLLVGQADDEVLPIAGQLDAFHAVHPRTDVLLTPAGDPNDPRQRYLHGTLSPAARAELERRMLTFLMPVRGLLHVGP